MLDSVEPIGLPEYAQDQHLLVCPKCATEFVPKRSNQKFCSRPCSKAATRNTSRGSRSAENKVTNITHHERATRLAEMVYSAPPSERLGVMQHILSFVDQDAGLRRILNDPKLLRQEPRRDNRKNISQVASAYTKMFFGVSIQTYIQQVRSGTLNEKHPVTRRVDHGSAPRLRPIKNIKCWHKPLATPPEI